MYLSKTAWQAVDCKKSSTGSYYMDQEGYRDIRCTYEQSILGHQHSYRYIFLIGVVQLLVFGVLLPFILWKFLHGTDLQDVNKGLKLYGWMYTRYRPHVSNPTCFQAHCTTIMPLKTRFRCDSVRSFLQAWFYEFVIIFQKFCAAVSLLQEVASIRRKRSLEVSRCFLCAHRSFLR